jgi:glutamate carboxypeptidase
MPNFFKSGLCVIPLVLAMSVSSSGQHSGGLADNERAIVQHIDAHGAAALKLLEQVVNINSGTQNFTGVRSVGKVRAGHLIAEHPAAGPKLLLIGHLDTVFELDNPFQKFERVSETAARGPGIIDMKGGNVVMLQALAALKAVGALEGMNVVVVMTGDEESAGDPQDVARAPLVAAAKGAIAALGFEDGAGDPRTAVIGRRGTTAWTVRVKGKPAHSSQIFRTDIGYGAVFEAARIVNAFREKLAGQAHLTFNPSIVLGGTQVEFDPVQARGTAFGKDNVIAEHAVVSGDLRALSLQQFADARTAMEAIVRESLPGTGAQIAFDEGYPPLSPTEGNKRLLAMYDQASRDSGGGPVSAVDPDRAGAADVSFVAAEVPMILDGIGLMGDGGHTAQETADLRTLPSQSKRAALLIYRLMKK